MLRAEETAEEALDDALEAIDDGAETAEEITAVIVERTSDCLLTKGTANAD